jgi:hypothetical protein
MKLVMFDNGENYSDWNVVGAMLIPDNILADIDALFEEFCKEEKAKLPPTAEGYPESVFRYRCGTPERKKADEEWSKWYDANEPRREAEHALRDDFGPRFEAFLRARGHDATLMAMDKFVSVSL